MHDIRKTLDEVFGTELIKLPMDYIREWIKSHFNEFLHKLHETNEKGYGTYIEDSLKFINPYTNEQIEISIEIQRNLYNPDEDNSIGDILQYIPKKDMILIGAKSFLHYFKSKQDIYGGLLRGITHELTHVVDPDRTSHPQELDSGYDVYVNSPREFPAFARMHIEYLRHRMEDPVYKKKVIDALKSGKKLPDSHTQEFIDKLNDNNLSIFKKLLQKELNQG